MNYINHWLGIQCFKHDGTIHRYWDRGLVLENNDDYIVIATKRAKVIENNGRRWFTKEPAVTIFSKKEWWNVICMLKKDGICYYCNIASPSIIEHDAIKYIDYDLDAKLFPNDDIRLLDEREYKFHKDLFHYSDDLDAVLKYTVKDINKKMKNREFPFVDDMIRDYYQLYLEILNKK